MTNNKVTPRTPQSHQESSTNLPRNASRLARIRENQRRSRAKKQEYIQELEQKLAFCQEEARQKDVQHRLAVQKLEAENRKLRYLLSSISGVRSGSGGATVEEFLQTTLDEESVIQRKVAIPALPRRRRSEDCSQEVVKEEEATGSRSLEQQSTTPSEVQQKVVPSDLGPEQQSGKSQSVCDCSPNGDESQWPRDEDVLNTTLCAIAEELINQYNTRGVDLVEIRKKLWDGFRKGLTTGEGCRVQNQILFQVLDEISND